jgi:hypothetical protein
MQKREPRDGNTGHDQPLTRPYGHQQSKRRRERGRDTQGQQEQATYDHDTPAAKVINNPPGSQ